jgi:hypothetical protein
MRCVKLPERSWGKQGEEREEKCHKHGWGRCTVIVPDDVAGGLRIGKQRRRELAEAEFISDHEDSHSADQFERQEELHCFERQICVE